MRWASKDVSPSCNHAYHCCMRNYQAQETLLDGTLERLLKCRTQGARQFIAEPFR